MTRQTMTSQTITSRDRPRATADRLIARLGRWLSRHSIDALRISLGLVFLGFGVPKFFPGMSPAEDLAIRTVETLSLGLVPGAGALFATAVIECFIGLTLITGRMLRTGLVVLAAALFGILSPVVLFSAELFRDGITLEAQYVLKDIILVSAALVIGAQALGARLTGAIPRR